MAVEEVVGGQKWPVLEHTDPNRPNRTRVVVLGSGWGAISMVKALNSKIRHAASGRSASACTAANVLLAADGERVLQRGLRYFIDQPSKLFSGAPDYP